MNFTSFYKFTTPIFTWTIFNMNFPSLVVRGLMEAKIYWLSFLNWFQKSTWLKLHMLLSEGFPLQVTSLSNFETKGLTEIELHYFSFVMWPHMTLWSKDHMTCKCVDEFTWPKGHVPFWIIASRRVTHSRLLDITLGPKKWINTFHLPRNLTRPHDQRFV